MDMGELVRYMADSTDNPSSSSKLRRVRGPTLMTQIDKVHQTGEKIKVEFDPRTYECTGVGKNAANFRSYIASLARQRCSILKDEWKDMDNGIKDIIWLDFQAHFTIPECCDKYKDGKI
ncbi:uncharacterized protein LOC131642057 [Vicia villosa]|uniref:uncharacterized protein LOC131642057 n=1 Tax=Vicia villosa TaxID=3911 RepID=UPI00273C1DE7|nr:uncharacterized protein LOC131642057 [Vicia villosa]